MVTREDVRRARKFLNKFKRDVTVGLSDDELNAIENLVADYEFKYNM